MEVECPGTQGLPTPNPGSKNIPKACPTRNPATSPACQTQPQPKHPSHRAKSSVENNNNNKQQTTIVIHSSQQSNEIKGGCEKKH